MSNFPQGPWEAHELSCEDHRGQGWVRAGDQDVAAYGDSSLWMEENRAIGKLIAAAPELLEALREGRRAIGDHSCPGDCYATGPVTGDKVRDLIECPACIFIAAYDAVIAKVQS